MNPDEEKPKPEETPPAEQPVAPETHDEPADALSRTPDDLGEEAAHETHAEDHADEPKAKEPSAIKKLFKRINVYLLLFGLLVVIAIAFFVVNYLNSQKPSPEAAFGSQKLTEQALQQLSNTDASLGNSSQTLTIQGNAIIDGQTLIRSNTTIAGTLQTSGGITGPSLTIAGATSLGTTQASSLQVQQTMAVQGGTTLASLNVAGTSSFSGAMTASQITASQLILSGNAVLEIPNHLTFTGPSPSRGSINPSVLGSGGSATVNGSDTAGTVNINTGGGPVAGCFVRINFAKPFTGQPHVLISPVGYGAGLTSYYVTRDTGGFSICAAVNPPANQAFAFDYFVAG
ncbi:MAG TPA: hypothetical protein VFQ70_03295 [Candidatus Saccharimonadaceae bacterium]|nr:hypothetical protein [Candidatus Saccharimonadaceae bacterium]